MQDMPQIKPNDIVRQIFAITGEEHVDVASRDYENDPINYNPAFGEVVAIYRYDGRDFKCIWESGKSLLCKLHNAIDEIREAQKEFDVAIKKLIAEVHKHNEEARRKQ